MDISETSTVCPNMPPTRHLLPNKIVSPAPKKNSAPHTKIIHLRTKDNKSFPSINERKYKMTDVIFYTTLGPSTRVSTVDKMEKRIVCSPENSYVCKRIGAETRSPTLLLLQQGTKLYVCKVTGPCLEDLALMLRRENTMVVKSERVTTAAAAAPTLRFDDAGLA